jgi:pyruvate kinase
MLESMTIYRRPTRAEATDVLRDNRWHRLRDALRRVRHGAPSWESVAMLAKIAAAIELTALNGVFVNRRNKPAW